MGAGQAPGEVPAPGVIEASEGLYRSIAENVPGMVFRFELSPQGELSLAYVSRGARELYELEPAQLLADAGLAMSPHPDDAEDYLRSVHESAQRLERWDWRGRIQLRRGAVKHVHGVSQPGRRADGTIVWDGVLLDVTEFRTAREREREIRRRLQVADEQFQVAFERAPIGMGILEPAGSLERVNDAACALIGHDPAALLAMAPLAFVHPGDRERVAAHLQDLIDGADTITLEHRLLHADGHAVWVQSRGTMIRDEHGRPIHVLVQIQDISEHRAHEQHLRHLADHDPLTGLLNRRGLETALDAHVARCRRYGAAGSLLLLDLDGFEAVNDRLGHAAGDRVLIACARQLHGRLRESDTLARLGGDEFAVLLPVGGETEASIVAESLIDTVRRCPELVGGLDADCLTASVGLAAFSDTTESAERMLVRAGEALYEAKQAGKNRYQAYAGRGPASVGAQARRERCRNRP